MKGFFNYLYFLCSFFLFSCSGENIPEEDSAVLIGDYNRYIVAKTSKGDFIAGIAENPTEENFTHLGSRSYSGTACFHDLGIGLHPAWDESLSSGSLDFVNFHERYCAGFEENSRFNTFFPPGNYTFSDGIAKGISINLNFSFELGVYYTTEGFEQPESSYIKITESIPDNWESGIGGGYFDFGQLLTGEFRARLHNPLNPSDFIDVSHGSFKLRIFSYSKGRLD